MTVTRYPHGLNMFVRLLDALGDGDHRVSLSLVVHTDEGVISRSDSLASLVDGEDRTGEYGRCLAEAAIRGIGLGGMAVRTVGDPDILRGWALRGDWPQPTTAGEIFAAHCTAPDGDLLPPMPGTDFRAGIAFCR
ncbi:MULTISPECIES: hypothetical protein [unclassified Streptomyces]|uniref:hypothetical protein n=1 Tax=unclassified Streptomyces TaxID=2593676 RepID=UPI000DB9F4BA|nr:MULTISPECIES: hypothetical protein [unclassified Streptomyces]MYT71191.1 hypothetical protein [Streptomyces sp. SID8367]RAJ69601.1 hypothetical protein K377_07995 [Streptomyces sp. PsTaAH-137]